MRVGMLAVCLGSLWTSVWYRQMLVFNEQHVPIMDIPEHASPLMSHLLRVLLP